MSGLQIMPMTASDSAPATSSGLQILPMTAQDMGGASSGFVAPGGMPGYVGKMTSTARQQEIPAGQAYTTNQGQVKSSPTESQVNTAQHELVTIKQMKPLFQKIAQQAPHFLGSGEMAKVRGEKFLGWLHQNIPGNTNFSGEIESGLGMSPQDLTNYDAYQTNLKTLAHQYMNAHGWSPTQENSAAALKAVSPGVGEGPAYVGRMSNLFNYLNKGIGNVNRKVLTGGLSTAPVNSSGITNNNSTVAESSGPTPTQNGFTNYQAAEVAKANLSNVQKRNLALGNTTVDKQGNTWIYIPPKNGLPGQLGMKPARK